MKGPRTCWKIGEGYMVNRFCEAGRISFGFAPITASLSVTYASVVIDLKSYRSQKA